MAELIALTEDPWLLAAIVAVGLLILIALRDIFFNKRHTIKHNFPIVGNLRYFLESIGPELRQYWVANDKEEMPFNRAERSWIYATAKQQNNTFGFGTTELLYGAGYPILKHDAIPAKPKAAPTFSDDPTLIPCEKIIGEARGRKRPYRPLSIINVSAMSFGSLGERAISSLNKGARIASCYHNTGEGGVSPYHKFGADLMWQLGTAYFGARTKDGQFSIKRCVETVRSTPEIRAIEIKLSQGAKPGKGGILPGRKVSKQISDIRGIPEGKDCYSPNYHSAFSSPDELIDFVELIAKETGLPVGIKAAVGKLAFFEELAKRMKKRKKGPDFITIDGGEGGTGAAPLTFADHVSLPFKVAFARVYQLFLAEGIADQIVWNGSAKLGFPDRTVVAMAMGCDLISVAREAMMAIGCIQAQKCHDDHCPAGIATQNKWLQAGVHVGEKSKRLAQFMQGFRRELLALSNASGYQHPSQFTGTDIEFSTGINKFSTLTDVMGYEKTKSTFTDIEKLRPTP